MSKSIRLSDEAYDRLAAHKRSDETFSETVLRLAGERSLLELAGILTDEQADELEAAIEDRRERRAEELDSRANWTEP
ncbi:antitoxin VapB family protein [Natrinema caseinilyticum]|uniref:antitoxin VapB family protein n=1 Tax=Natrinema caseinilyticum TaxID=2961570 RepID=UPI0020C2D5EA|nr:antitoxin VapB family protein [Natrinema caseinilyticum]